LKEPYLRRFKIIEIAADKDVFHVSHFSRLCEP
jgi:hypothetical protein